MRKNPRGRKVIPGPTLGLPPLPRFLRFARTLTLASGVAPALGGWSCGDTGQKSSTDAFMTDTRAPDAKIAIDVVVSGVQPLPADARTSDGKADATLAEDASSNDGFFPGIQIMPDAGNPNATDASHPADATGSPYDGAPLGVAAYDGGPLDTVGISYDGGPAGSRPAPGDAATSDSAIADARGGDRNVRDGRMPVPYDGGPVGSAPAPGDAAASDAVATDVRGAYDGRILGVVVMPPDAGVVAVDAQGGDRIAVGGPQPAPELPDGWWATTEV